MTMNRLRFTFAAMMFGLVLPLCFCGGCDENEEIVMTPEGTFSAWYLQGQDTARQYAAGNLADYEVVWRLYDLLASQREEFLDGFEAGYSDAGDPDSAATYRTVLQEAVTGKQFDTAKDLGAKHADKAVTNEQIQGIIHSSLGVSRGVALGWKGGYIRGFGAQRIADTAAADAVDELTIAALHKEAAAAYHALRAAIGQ
jgi:hypothetical protein